MPFVHHPYLLPPCERVETEHGRRYRTPEGKLYPSLTAVLSSVLPKDGIQQWKRRVGDKEAARVSAIAARRGTLVHSIMEDYVHNLPITFPNPDAQVLASQLMKPLDENVTSIHGIECKMFSDRLKVGGTCDLIATWNGVPSIVDYKTSSSEKQEGYIQSYFLQATVYSCMLQELTGILAPQIVILIASHETPKAQVWVKKRNDYLAEAVSLVKSYGF